MDLLLFFSSQWLTHFSLKTKRPFPTRPPLVSQQSCDSSILSPFYFGNDGRNIYISCSLHVAPLRSLCKSTGRSERAIEKEDNTCESNRHALLATRKIKTKIVFQKLNRTTVDPFCNIIWNPVRHFQRVNQRSESSNVNIFEDSVGGKNFFF